MAKKFDPWEDAKKPTKAKPKTPASKKAKAAEPEPEDAPVSGGAEKQPVGEASDSEPETAEVHVPHVCPCYVVKETKVVSIDGYITTMTAGAEIDSASYGGKVGIDRLLEQGLELEQVKPK